MKRVIRGAVPEGDLEEQLISKIKVPYRRLDSVSNSLQGQDGGAAIYFDGSEIIMASNSQQQSELSLRISNHLCFVASVDYAEPGFVNRVNQSRAQLLKYAHAISDHISNNWYKDFVADLERIESSINASIILVNPGLASYFSKITDPERIAFPPEMVEAIKKGITFIEGSPGVHAELKLTQKILEDGAKDDFASSKQHYIGISKKCCVNCQSAIIAVDKVFSRFPPPSGLPIADEEMPGDTYKIVTRDILAGIRGSDLSFPCAPPSFLEYDGSESPLINGMVAGFRKEFFAERQRVNPAISTIDAAFRENSASLTDRQVMASKMRRTYSLSPTGRERAVEGYVAMMLAKDLDVAEEKAVGSRSAAADNRGAEASALDEFSTTAVAAAPKKKKNKKLAKTDESDDELLSRLIIETQQKRAEELLLMQKRQAEELLIAQHQPIILFYEISDQDITSTQVITELLRGFKEDGIDSLVIVDNNMASYKGSPLKFLENNPVLKEKRLSRDPEIKEIVEIYDTYKQMLSTAGALYITTYNAGTVSGETSETAEYGRRSTAILNERIKDLATRGETDYCHDEQVMGLFREDLTSRIHADRSERIANKIFEECSKTKGVVALLEIADAKTVEQKLVDLGCSNVVSFCVYKNLERLDTDISSHMWRHNQDYAQTQMIPKSIIVNASGREIREVVHDLVRPYLPSPSASLTEHKENFVSKEITRGTARKAASKAVESKSIR